MNDCWSLNISTIVGPPYAIFSISPSLGPLTGKTKVIITGAGYKDSQNIVVRFASGKTEKEVAALYISETELSCETPTFDVPKKVDVFVSINKADYTITSTSFTYYLNTKAENTIAYGPGLLENNALGADTQVII